MTTDIGSLFNLGDEEIDNDTKFICTCYSEGYASPEYIEAVKN